MIEPNPISVNFRLFEGRHMKAFVDVTLATTFGLITISGFRINQKEGEEPWVAFPNTTYTAKSGEVKKKLILDMGRVTRKSISDFILGEYKGLEPKKPN